VERGGYDVMLRGMLFTYIFILCKGKDAAAYCDYISKADLLRTVMFGERKLGKNI
jgi:hypothetical protein